MTIVILLPKFFKVVFEIFIINYKYRKRPSKVPPHKRRNQKQARRQTAPVDLAYEAHQRQKYKTLVSLNAQTLRKVKKQHN